jgi:NADH-quinone oxidoreductase subunit K
MAVPVEYYLVLSAAVFCTGLFGVLTRENALMFLISVELMLNAANINFVAFSHYYGNLTGQVFALFTMALAAAEEAAVLVVDDHEEIARVLADVYPALGVAFDPESVGSVAASGGDTERVRDELEDALVGDADPDVRWVRST